MKSNKNGFTLIELIVVIAILAVLSMILVPSLTGYIKRSEKSIAISNSRTCYLTGYYAKSIDKDNWQTTVKDLLEPSFKCKFNLDGHGELESASWIEDDGVGAVYHKNGDIDIIE